MWDYAKLPNARYVQPCRSLGKPNIDSSSHLFQVVTSVACPGLITCTEYGVSIGLARLGLNVF